MDKEYEDISWTIKLNHQFKEKLQPYAVPRFKHAVQFIGLSLRYIEYHRDCLKKHTTAYGFFNPIKCKQIYGAPIGGIGTGSIGRSFTGDFTRFQLIPGIYEHETADPNLFTVCIRKNSKTVYQQTLAVRRSKLKGLQSWNMAYNGEYARYHALYPQSWTVYDLPGQNVTLTCHQISPILPNNYKDTSLPVALFNWTIENLNNEDIELSLMFTWQSGSSSDKFTISDVSSRSFSNYNNNDTSISGVVLSQKLKNIPLDYCISVREKENQNITYNCQFYPDIEESGSNLWLDLLKDVSKNEILLRKARLAIAVCVQAKVKALSSEKIEFSLVWNMPQVSFGGNQKTYKKFYTRYFTETNESTPLDISTYAFANQDLWLNGIKKWQQPILENESLPSWFKIVLFNELYFISDGGTVWFDLKDDPACKHETVREYGRFGYLEGHEYRMYNTYDVHFNANFALLQLWPKLQVSLQYEFADTIPIQSDNKIKFLIDGKYDYQKSKNSLPHDIGDPFRDPWIIVNAYNSHDTRDWKDLNLKFILTVYRDYYYLKDLEYLKHMWPYIKSLMITVQSQDHDNDGLIDSEGLPDQTYDAWFVKGASAYCGGLHCAALKCVCEMAKLLKEEDIYEKYSEILKRAKNSYDTKLWNGKYYKYDCSDSDYNDSIMTDMCCGHWYLRSCGFEYDVFEKDKIKSCLETIFEYNVMKYGNGNLGAVNGMRPNGTVDTTSLQSEEVWTGITDAFSSLLIYEVLNEKTKKRIEILLSHLIFQGMNEKAWKTLEGMYNLLYNKLGLAFQTPEALVKSNETIYRSLGYMRPLCVWSVQYALEEMDLKSKSTDL